MDRQGWADLTDLVHKVHVKGCGEALEGPYYFGVAFEAPPTFTWSGVPSQASGGTVSVIPLLTVGVAAWIIDPQGMYVGAHLWFKVKDQEGTIGCDAYLGVAPPVGAVPIRWATSEFQGLQLGPVDPSYGENVIDDPGFEESALVPEMASGVFPVMTVNYSGAPANPTGLAWINGPIYTDWTAVTEPPGWFHSYSDADDVHHWSLSTEDPRTGTYHATWTRVQDWPSDNPQLSPYGGTACHSTLFAEHWLPYSARVEPGDLVEYTIWAKLHGPTSNNFGFIQMEFYDVWGQIQYSQSSDGFELSDTEYRKVSYALPVPENVKYVLPWLSFWFQFNVGDGAHVDDGEVKVLSNPDVGGHDCGVVFDTDFSDAATGWPGTVWTSPSASAIAWADQGHLLLGGNYVYGYNYWNGSTTTSTSSVPMAPGLTGGGSGGNDMVISQNNPLATGGWAAGMAFHTTSTNGFGIYAMPKVGSYSSNRIWLYWDGDYTALVRPGDHVTVTFDAMITDHLSTTGLWPDHRIRVWFQFYQVDGSDTYSHMCWPAFQMGKSSDFITHQTTIVVPELNGFTEEGGPYYLQVSLTSNWRGTGNSDRPYFGSTAPITVYEEYWVDKFKVEVDCAPVTCRNTMLFNQVMGNSDPVDAQIQRLGPAPSGNDDLPALLETSPGVHEFWWAGFSGTYDPSSFPTYGVDGHVNVASGEESPPWRYTSSTKDDGAYSVYRAFSDVGGGLFSTGELELYGSTPSCEAITGYGSDWPFLLKFCWGHEMQVSFAKKVDTLDTNMKVRLRFYTLANTYVHDVTLTGTTWTNTFITRRILDWAEIDDEGYGYLLKVTLEGQHNGSYTGNLYLDDFDVSQSGAFSPYT